MLKKKPKISIKKTKSLIINKNNKLLIFSRIEIGPNLQTLGNKTTIIKNSCRMILLHLIVCITMEVDNQDWLVDAENSYRQQNQLKIMLEGVFNQVDLSKNTF